MSQSNLSLSDAQICTTRTMQAKQPIAVGGLHVNDAHDCCDGADEAERGRPNITKEQLSAAQLAVQRSLRGLTGPDAAKTLEGDPSLASEGRALKRGSALMTYNPLSRRSSGYDPTQGELRRMFVRTPELSPEADVSHVGVEADRGGFKSGGPPSTTSLHFIHGLLCRTALASVVGLGPTLSGFGEPNEANALRALY